MAHCSPAGAAGPPPREAGAAGPPDRSSAAPCVIVLEATASGSVRPGLKQCSVAAILGTKLLLRRPWPFVCLGGALRNSAGPDLPNTAATPASQSAPRAWAGRTPITVLAQKQARAGRSPTGCIRPAAAGRVATLHAEGHGNRAPLAPAQCTAPLRPRGPKAVGREAERERAALAP
jgi:hypothetical protein